MVILRILVTNVLSVNHLMFKQGRCSLTKRLLHYQTGSSQVVVADRWNQAVKLKGFKSESWHFSWLWAHRLSSLVFGDFLCKIKMKTLYTIPTSQGCCENQVKMYVKALCNFVIFQSPHFPWFLPSPYQIQYYNLPEGCTLILHSLLPYKWMVQTKWSTCPPGYLVLVWNSDASKMTRI